MKINVLIPTSEDLLEYDLIMERNEKIRPIAKEYKAGKISLDDFIEYHDKIVSIYNNKIKELDNEQKSIMSK